VLEKMKVRPPVPLLFKMALHWLISLTRSAVSLCIKVCLCQTWHQPAYHSYCSMYH